MVLETSKLISTAKVLHIIIKHGLENRNGGFEINFASYEYLKHISSENDTKIF